MQVGRNEIVAGTVSPSYILANSMAFSVLSRSWTNTSAVSAPTILTNEPLLKRGLELLDMLKEDLN